MRMKVKSCNDAKSLSGGELGTRKSIFLECFEASKQDVQEFDVDEIMMNLTLPSDPLTREDFVGLFKLCNSGINP